MSMPATMNAPDKKHDNFFMRHAISLIVTAVVLVILAVWLIPTAAIPLANGDGTTNYSGAKKQAAIWAVHFIRNTKPVSPLPSFIQRVKVADVRPTSDEEKAASCKDGTHTASDPNQPNYYTVDLEYGQLFSFSSTKESYAVCYLQQWDPGYLE